MSNGALFYKADLHIHSYGPDTGSFDVTDVSNTPQAIVDTAIEKGLEKSEYAVTSNELKNQFDIPIQLFLSCIGYQ